MSADGTTGVSPRVGAPRPPAVYLHLGAALEIMRREPDYRKWGDHIDQLPPDARQEVRDWLYVEAEKIRAFQRWQARSTTEAGLLL